MALNFPMIVMDGKAYRVRVVYPSLSREFELLEGPNASTMLSGRNERDLLGTGYSYEMQLQPDPTRPLEYDALYEALSEPVDSHEIVLPYGQSSITFQAMIKSGRDLMRGRMAGVTRWGDLSVRYEYIEPQRVPL